MDEKNIKYRKTFEELGIYVYALVYPKAYTKKHPEERGIFYIGKGTYDRVLQHIKDAEKPKSKTIIKTEKLDTIRKIKKEGFEIDYYILRHQIPSDEEAFAIESVCINLLSYDKFDFCCLTNDQKGHGQNDFGIKTLDELAEQYGNLPYLQINDDSELLCICINKNYGKNDDNGKPISIYEAVKGYWKLSKERADECKYVIAEYQGISRGVFKVNSSGWKKKRGSTRYYFDGKDVSLKEGKQYMNCILPPKNKGSANPCRYLNKYNCNLDRNVEIEKFLKIFAKDHKKDWTCEDKTFYKEVISDRLYIYYSPWDWNQIGFYATDVLNKKEIAFLDDNLIKVKHPGLILQDDIINDKESVTLCFEMEDDLAEYFKKIIIVIDNLVKLTDSKKFVDGFLHLKK